MGDSKRLARVVLVAAILLVAGSPVLATFHFARITEIFTGSAEYPNVQYIVIVPFFDGQNLFGTVNVTVFDSTGTALPNFAAFAANLPNNLTNQQSILVANPAAQTLFGIAPEQAAVGSLPVSGLICFQKGVQTPDCVSYGNYTGLTTVGGSQAGPPAAAAPNGMALRRTFGLDGILDFGDDTDNSLADFGVQVPTPKNFTGITVSTLTVDKVGAGIDLNWNGSGAAASTIHKTGDPSTVRLSAAVGAVGVMTWPDPDPNQFPGLSCYLVKP